MFAAWLIGRKELSDLPSYQIRSLERQDLLFVVASYVNNLASSEQRREHQFEPSLVGFVVVKHELYVVAFSVQFLYLNRF
jgi:hypothetical protein